MLARLLTLLILLVTGLVGPASVLAQAEENNIHFSFLPVPADDPAITAKGYFVYTLTPGLGMTGSVQLQNTGKQPITIELASIDATTAQTGGSAYALADAPATAVGAWVTLATSSVTLPPGAQEQVAFTVRAPETIKPGQYLAGIAAYARNKSAQDTVTRGQHQAGAAIAVQARYVIAVQVEVPGEWTPLLTIPGVRVLDWPAGTHAGIQIRNDGDTFLKPSGSVSITDATGQAILVHPIKMDTFVTGSEVTYPVAWPGKPAAGIYQVAIELSYADGKSATYHGELEIAPDASAIRPAQAALPKAVSATRPAQPYTVAAAEGITATPGSGLFWTIAGGIIGVVILGGLMFLVGRRTARR